MPNRSTHTSRHFCVQCEPGSRVQAKTQAQHKSTTVFTEKQWVDGKDSTKPNTAAAEGRGRAEVKDKEAWSAGWFTVEQEAGAGLGW